MAGRVAAPLRSGDLLLGPLRGEGVLLDLVAPRAGEAAGVVVDVAKETRFAGVVPAIFVAGFNPVVVVVLPVALLTLADRRDDDPCLMGVDRGVPGAAAEAPAGRGLTDDIGMCIR